MNLRRPRWRGTLAALAVLVLSVSVSGADARTGSPSVRAAVPDAARVAAAAQAQAVGKGEYGIPPIANMDPNTGNPVPYAGAAVTNAQASRSKVSVNLPEITISAYANFCVAFPNGDGTFFETCCADPTTACEKVDPPTSSYDVTGNVSWIRIVGPTWVNSPKGVRPTFGTFPSVRVKALAFGSIPVTATVNLEQTVGRDGYYDPLSFFYEVSSEYPAGETVTGYGTSPASTFEPTRGSFVYLPARLAGDIDVRLSDVSVDGRPVNVGDSCRTATPARLTLGAAGGFSDVPSDTTQPSDFYGRPGSFTTNPGARLDGNLSIPRFQGCGNGREDLDPLITSLVSSPRNLLAATLTTTLDVCTVDVPTCPQIPTLPAQVTPERRAAKASATRTTSSSSALMQPAVQKRLVRALAQLSPRLRNDAVTALPLAVRGPVLEGLKRQR